jgi:hypothetical protein
MSVICFARWGGVLVQFDNRGGLHALLLRNGRMRGAIRFDAPAGKQQSKNDAKHHLFLFGQAVHTQNIKWNRADNNVFAATGSPISQWDSEIARNARSMVDRS